LLESSRILNITKYTNDPFKGFRID